VRPIYFIPVPAAADVASFAACFLRLATYVVLETSESRSHRLTSFANTKPCGSVSSSDHTRSDLHRRYTASVAPAVLFSIPEFPSRCTQGKPSSPRGPSSRSSPCPFSRTGAFRTLAWFPHQVRFSGRSEGKIELVRDSLKRAGRHPGRNLPY
jgi:hypothetical protein